MSLRTTITGSWLSVWASAETGKFRLTEKRPKLG
jgi:hypothetical protein